jgi:Bacterial trigger factor protein (TF)/Bacterial trigger factor protein (TF) C-terminus
MSPNPSEPVLEIIDDLVLAELHTAAWAICAGKGWYFGHGSHPDDWSRFWKMDLDGDAVFNAIWEQVRPRCEALAGAPLRVVRQYANGHTYGLGGQPHLDDTLPGSYTLLYYPNPEWKDGWKGETVFYDLAGEISLAVRPRPNRSVFFDSRIPHSGRAPGRLCPALRVTVAYKLHVVETPADSAVTGSEVAEKRSGASRVYRVRVGAALVEKPVEEQLERLGKTVRLPGFRPGKIPIDVLRKRYGVRARAEAINRIVAETTPTVLPQGSVVSSFAILAGVESGDLEFETANTYMPDLPAVDFSGVTIERLIVEEALSRRHVKLQVLDHLDEVCSIPLLPFLIEREFATIWSAAAAQGQPLEDAAEFRAIAARRLRLGLMVGEIARRNGITAGTPAELEDRVIDLLVSESHVSERQATPEELAELIGEE